MRARLTLFTLALLCLAALAATEPAAPLKPAAPASAPPPSKPAAASSVGVAQIGQLFAATGLQPRGQDAVVPGLLTGFGGFGGAEAERPPVRASLQQGGAFGGSMEAPLLLGQRDGGAKQGMPQPTIGLLGRRMGLDGAGQYAGQWQHDDESRGQYERRRQYADEPDSRYDSRHGQYTDDSYWSDGQYEGKRPYEEDEEPRPHYGRYNEDEHEGPGGRRYDDEESRPRYGRYHDDEDDEHDERYGSDHKRPGRYDDEEDEPAKEDEHRDGERAEDDAKNSTPAPTPAHEPSPSASPSASPVAATPSPSPPPPQPAPAPDSAYAGMDKWGWSPDGSAANRRDHPKPKVPINRIPAAWRKAAAAGPQGESVPAATEESQALTEGDVKALEEFYKRKFAAAEVPEPAAPVPAPTQAAGAVADADADQADDDEAAETKASHKDRYPGN